LFVFMIARVKQYRKRCPAVPSLLSVEDDRLFNLLGLNGGSSSGIDEDLLVGSLSYLSVLFEANGGYNYDDQAAAEWCVRDCDTEHDNQPLRLFVAAMLDFEHGQGEFTSEFLTESFLRGFTLAGSQLVELFPQARTNVEPQLRRYAEQNTLDVCGLYLLGQHHVDTEPEQGKRWLLQAAQGGWVRAQV
jgi:hypothetical protein